MKNCFAQKSNVEYSPFARSYLYCVLDLMCIYRFLVHRELHSSFAMTKNVLDFYSQPVI